MFNLRPANIAEINAQRADFRGVSAVCPRILAPVHGLESSLPISFAHDRTRTCIDSGIRAFNAAKEAFANWKMFDLGWVHVANLDARIIVGEVVVVEACTFGLWSLNISKIVEIIDSPTRFGFIYSTTESHVEFGEERFLIEIDSSTENVFYDIEAVSRPAHWAARLGLPITRAFQHKFARCSHRRLRELIT